LASSSLMALSLAYRRKLLGEPETPVKQGRTAIFTPAILPIGLLAFIALFTEGVMMDWSAVYTARVAQASSWLAPLSYGAFCSAMAVGRLLGDGLIQQWGARKLLKTGGSLIMAGLVLMVSVHAWPATFLGLILAGFGLANLVPIFLKLAGEV